MSQPQPLRQQIQQQFADRALDEQSLDSMMALQKQQSGSAERRRWINIGGVAALLLIAVLSGWLAMPEASHQGPRLAIFEEVVYNHIKQRPLEIRGESLELLRPWFTELDFALRDSDKLTEARLLGGRYCSIAGRTAAQLRYVEQGRLNTVYQVEYQPAVHGEFAEGELQTRNDRGYSVKLWHESGILYAKVFAE